MAISGNVIAVGDQTVGAVYVYRFSGSQWVEEAKLMPPAEMETRGFGAAVSISGNVIIIGAEENIGGAFYEEYAGLAFVYRFTESRWQEEALLHASDPTANDGFGRAVAISGNRAIVGAPYDSDAAAANSGSAYVFRYDGSNWRQEVRLNSEQAGQAYFGASVAVTGSVALIGAPFYDRFQYEVGSEPGAAYVYRWDGSAWREQEKLAASDGFAGNSFGAAVALDGRMAIVGAPAFEANSTSVAAAYIYVLE